MKVVALVSGGKDSCFNMMHCVANGHEIVALANLLPPEHKGKDELDSFMFQTVGHDAIGLYADCMGLPMFRKEIKRSSVVQDANYVPNDQDEVEDLLELLSEVKSAVPQVEAVAVGAILSSYQRVRVENVCQRLGLTSLAYLWRRDQAKLMEEMIESGLHAVIIKVAAMGLSEKHLGQSLQQIHPHLVRMNQLYDCHICGEGGEYETLTLDCPLFKKRIVLDSTEVVVHSDDALAIVAYLKIKAAHVVDKEGHSAELSEELKQRLIRAVPTSIELPAELLSKSQDALLSDSEGPQRPELVVKTGPPISERRQGSFYSLSGVTALAVDPGSVGGLEEQALCIMNHIQDKLGAQGMSWGDVLIIHVYVRDMDDFAKLNSVYGTFFTINPPTRVTVEAPLPRPILAQIDCLAFRDPGGSRRKETLHVQGISYWAPANIGPYSQAAMIMDQIILAGQIPLIGASMTMPNPYHSGVTTETLQSEFLISLLNVSSVLSAVLNLVQTEDDTAAVSHPWLEWRRNVIGGVCYCVSQAALVFARDVWNHTLEREGIAPLPVLFVNVTRLPRNAHIEWQLFAHNPNIAYGRCLESISHIDTTELLRTAEYDSDDDHDKDDTIRSKLPKPDTNTRASAVNDGTPTGWSVHQRQLGTTSAIVGLIRNGNKSGDPQVSLAELCKAAITEMHKLAFPAGSKPDNTHAALRVFYVCSLDPADVFAGFVGCECSTTFVPVFSLEDDASVGIYMDCREY
ncbi:uncharacterized protein BJ171DRAFT_492743 [Polychytrium aggregatum]|uniref:uncharacterized protein n=1 Tax=Polychytrium aggregatum TaxID=110093 RepID=UPI0022FED561|nr:uncharacterized protein BJ171DRAFT_492743 [Polychytrium aggregatum]KAI9207435.1 hypothetical protein BJ171DRAFT_492743 [Polychytrium aggregatum]